ARADLHERLTWAGRPHVHGGDQLVRLERVPLRAEQKVAQREGFLTPCALEHKLGFGDQEGRKRIPGRGGCAEVAADRAAVADLRATDRARGLRERGCGLRKWHFH